MVIMLAIGPKILYQELASDRCAHVYHRTHCMWQQMVAVFETICHSFRSLFSLLSLQIQAYLIAD
jgi:hypothetical protein